MLFSRVRGVRLRLATKVVEYYTSKGLPRPDSPIIFLTPQTCLSCHHFVSLFFYVHAHIVDQFFFIPPFDPSGVQLVCAGVWTVGIYTHCCLPGTESRP
jgi:hypothetical protein